MPRQRTPLWNWMKWAMLVVLCVLRVGEMSQGLVDLNGFVEDVGSEPSVKCGMWTGRKEGASSLWERLEPADTLCWLWWRWACGLSGNAKAAVGFGFERLRALHSWTTGDFPVFPTPNESSFRTLTCLLALPQEGNDTLAPHLPGCALIQNTKRGT